MYSGNVDQLLLNDPQQDRQNRTHCRRIGLQKVTQTFRQRQHPLAHWQGWKAVRLPAEFRFEGKEVFIEYVGDAVVLRARPVDWDDFFASESETPDDFLADREDAPPQDRDWFQDVDA